MKQSVLLPSPEEIKSKYPCTGIQNNFIASSRKKIIDILNGSDTRLLLIVGPCSIHDCTAAREYAEKLKKLSTELENDFLIVMRTYFEKPRTSTGWKGLLYDPYLNQSCEIETGLSLSRQLLLDLADLELPAATEFLDPFTSLYYGDLISWGCVGARTTASQPHREIASGLPLPIGFKNSTDGNIDIAIHANLAAGMPQSYISLNDSGRPIARHTEGNPHCHIVLRGSEAGENYDPSSIELSLKKLESSGLPPRLLIDCSHDNSRRNPETQCIVFQSVLNQFIEGNSNIRGMLLESNLNGGSQPLSNSLTYGISVTDPCLDWTSTENIIQWGSQRLKALTMASKYV